MSKPARSAKAADFLSKMNLNDSDDLVIQPAPERVTAAVIPEPAPVKAKAVKVAKPATPKAPKSPPSRKTLKHVGAYLEQSEVEKVALLRARLNLGNSELIALAINNLYKTEATKRKFGDA